MRTYHEQIHLLEEFTIMDGFEPATTRDAAGRFLPGASGNPAGKKPGTRNRKTVLAEALRDGEDTAVARVVIDKALAGDGVAARFCLGLLSPKPRGRPIVLDLPENARAGDILAAFDATLAAMASGDITPDEALIITRVLDGRRRALEAVALERRLDAGEAPETTDVDDAPDARESASFACISPAFHGRAPSRGTAPESVPEPRRRPAAVASPPFDNRRVAS
jgi:hypothetical protein